MSIPHSGHVCFCFFRAAVLAFDVSCGLNLVTSGMAKYADMSQLLA